MIVIGADFLVQATAGSLRTFKAVFNEEGIIFFPTTPQHSSVNAAGISYEDDYQGNALAAILDGQKCEIRRHQDFTPNRVWKLWQLLLSREDLKPLAPLRVTYQGQPQPPQCKLGGC